MPDVRIKRYRKPATPAEFALLSQYYGRKKWDWNVDQLPDYIGMNRRQDAATTDDDWIIIKYTWDGNGNPTDYQYLIGTWDGRAALGWV